MESRLRAALLEWLREDPYLATKLNKVTEEAPARASPPWLGIAASASADWSTKDRTGREVRAALELHYRGDEPESGAVLMRMIEYRVEDFPRAQDGFDVITVRFQRARIERRANAMRTALLEYRFRLLETPSE